MVKERRDMNRARRRLRVRFGLGKPEKTAFTKNISHTGVFIHSNTVFKPGTTLQLEIQFPDRTFSMWGHVVWAKKVPPQLAHILDCGMGVCFVNPPDDWEEYFRAWKSSMKA